MVIKVKEFFEKTRQVKNNNKSKKYILRGHRNTRYHERILSNKKRNLLFQQTFTNFLEDYNRYRAENFNIH